MYQSPIEVYIEQALNNITEQRDKEICSYITEKMSIQVNREELIHALRYDKYQYDKGYNEGKKEALELYKQALLNTEFLKYNYGIDSIDAHFISSFDPMYVISDYREWKMNEN